MAYIIGDTKTFEAIVLSNNLPQKVLSGMSLKGGQIVEFTENYPEVGLREDLRSAIIKKSGMKTNNQFIDTIQQIDKANMRL